MRLEAVDQGMHYTLTGLHLSLAGLHLEVKIFSGLQSLLSTIAIEYNQDSHPRLHYL